MTVNVYVPEAKDRIAEVAKTLQIVQAVYGIRTENEQHNLYKAKAEQEKLATEEKLAESKRRKEGSYNQQEYDKLNIVPAGTVGARAGWIHESVNNPENDLPLKDAEGNDVTQKRGFFYLPDTQSEGQIKATRASSDELKLQEELARSNGIIPTVDLLDPNKVANKSLTPIKGWREGKTIIGGKETNIYYITPHDVQAQERAGVIAFNQGNVTADNQRAAEAGQRSKEASDRAKAESDLRIAQKQPLVEEIAKREALKKSQETGDYSGLIPKRGPLVLAPEFLPENQKKGSIIPGTKVERKLNADQQLGFQGAQDAGIANPTASDIVNYNPKKIEQDRARISSRIQSEKLDQVYGPLINVDNVIGGIDSKDPIPGIGDIRAGLATFAPAGLDEKALRANEKRIKQAVDNLRNKILMMTSGQAVTPSEAERAYKALGTGAFSSSDSLRNGLRTTRDIIKVGLQSIESGYSKQSNDAYRENPVAVHSGLPFFNKKARADVPKSIHKTNEQAIDEVLGE